MQEHDDYLRGQHVELPLSGLTGSQRFHSCSTSLVSGNGTVWASNKTAYTYFRIDTASTPGCIMAT